MHRRDQQSILINALSEGATITAACKHAGVSRMTYHRLYKDNASFRKRTDEALLDGRRVNNDIALASFQKQVRDGNWQPTRYYLEHHIAPYKERASQNKAEREKTAALQREVMQYLVRMRPISDEHMASLRQALTNWGIDEEILTEIGNVKYDEKITEVERESELTRLFKKLQSEMWRRLAEKQQEPNDKVPPAKPGRINNGYINSSRTN